MDECVVWSELGKWCVISGHSKRCTLKIRRPAFMSGVPVSHIRRSLISFNFRTVENEKQFGARSLPFHKWMWCLTTSRKSSACDNRRWKDSQTSQFFFPGHCSQKLHQSLTMFSGVKFLFCWNEGQGVAEKLDNPT